MLVKIDSPVELGKFYRQNPTARDTVHAIKKTVTVLNPTASIGLVVDDSVLQVSVFASNASDIIRRYSVSPFVEVARQAGFKLELKARS